MSETSTRKRARAGSKEGKGKTPDVAAKLTHDQTEQADALHIHFREAGMLALLLVAGIIAIALLTYSPTDPGWSYTGYEGTVQNSIGRFGAWLSDLFYSLFGIFAWLIPAIAVLKAITVFRFRYEPWLWRTGLFVLRSTGLLVALIAGAGLAGLHLHGFDGTLPSGSGGILGKVVVDWSLPALNTVGSSLIFGTFLLAGITIYTRISWFKVLDQTGRWLVTLISLIGTGCVWCLEFSQAKVAYWREQRELDREAFEEKAVTRREPVLERHEPVLEQDAIVILPAPEAQSETTKSQAKSPAKKIINKVAQALSEPSEDIAPEGERPTAGLLDEIKDQGKGVDPSELEAISRLLEAKLADFGVKAEVVDVHPGPVITRYEIQPAPGVKASKISNLARDLARSLAVVSVRVVEVIPGKSVVGIEIPNDDRETVFFGELINSTVFEKSEHALSLALGHDIAGDPVVVNLAKMPHLLVAGTTGSGKSVGVNAMILSMLFKSGPEDVRLIMIDPKMLELSIYDGIPHLLSPVVTDMKEAANALRWCVAEMERRYKLMAALGVRNIGGYNDKVKAAQAAGEPLRDPFYETLTLGDVAPELETLPFIVVVVDEFADMMMIVGKKVEELIARIAQKARAAGIHLILATQRPSVDVITGLIKANVPTRISFQVSSKIDSRTIIDQGGAEQLLGHGDMLYLPPGTSVPIRIHGAFVSDDEVHRVVADWKKRGEPNYVDEVLNGMESGSEGSAFSGGLDEDSEKDALYDEAVAFVTESRRASISSVQRKLKIGYNRAANMIEAMEAAGVISPAGHNGNREVIAPPPVKG
ncbi:cell division protein FtsK [Endozoicomonas sp. OPT23]|uniref:DNA translocase FtsK n=1 Tax=Endozoicomonas sp. OPT23 TaxID=2072845 RepID=UPI00129BAE27|nr:DNA translocase FtsK [Endozoicomonas sp. OPT23]MRI34436.1 cell division protein FtsK [Endozoicomonas sp. OPT23]